MTIPSVTVAYLDTSALAKLYVQEAGRDRVEALIRSTDAVATSVIAYPEACAVFARRRDTSEITHEEHTRMVTNFGQDWAGVNEIDLTPNVYRSAGQLVVAHPRLRAMDAIHLASALEARVFQPIRFLTFDHHLQVAAIALLSAEEMA
jgi:uncharacterized protein